MPEQVIVKYWREGHSREWLIKEEKNFLKSLAKTKEEKKRLAWQAQHNVETALLNYWRKEVCNGR